MEPILVVFPKEEETEIEIKLLKELPGILNWALEGLKEYHRIVLQPPRAAFREANLRGQ